MTAHDHLLARDAPVAVEQAAPLPSWNKSIGRRLMAWVHSCADYWAAAAMYDQLSALSDGELARRGLSRATLAHDVRAACDCLPSGEPQAGFTARTSRAASTADAASRQADGTLQAPQVMVGREVARPR